MINGNNLVQKTFNGEKWRIITPVILVALTLVSGNVLWMMNRLAADITVNNIRMEKLGDRLQDIEIRLENVVVRSSDIPTIKKEISDLTKQLGKLEVK